MAGSSPCHAMPYRAVPCCAVFLPCHAMPCRAVFLPCHAMPCCIMPCSCHAVSCHAMPCSCHAVSCHAMFIHAVSCHATNMPSSSQCHAASCRAIMLCRVMPFHGMHGISKPCRATASMLHLPVLFGSLHQNNPKLVHLLIKLQHGGHCAAGGAGVTRGGRGGCPAHD